MTLRDLTPDQLRDMQQRCEAEFSNWQNGAGQKPRTPQEIWNYAYSCALRARLELETKP